MELAASWKPLRKSKTRATKMMKMIRVSIEGAEARAVSNLSGRARSTVLQHDALQRVAHVFAAVDGVFDVVVQLLPLHDFQRLHSPGEEAAEGGVVVVVADALLVVDLDQLVAQLRQLAAAAQAVDRFTDRNRCLHQHVRLLLE